MKAFVDSIEAATIANQAFRNVLFTTKHLQLVAMSLLPGEDVGYEVHPHTDQFFRIEKGRARFMLGKKGDEDDQFTLRQGGAVIVPAGMHHNVINASLTQPLKFYTLYGPPEHRAGTFQVRKPKTK